MSWIRRSAGGLVVAVMAMGVAGCTSESTNRSIDCAAPVFTYQSTSYRMVPDANFTPGKKLGVATAPACDDTEGKSEDAVMKEAAYEVDGVSPKVAIALYGDTAKTAALFVVDSGSGLPPEVQKLIDPS
ncbi:DUF6281 family protein [Streptomyces sp. NPDC005892]|uniref:DUF6281 family protein n=1 Tax=Streptomyces sp. NPDC005892 TaxID=3155593 RepID=UPI0033E7DFF6